MAFDDDLQRSAQEYAQRHGLTLGKRLGSGVHGSVFTTECQPEKNPAEAQSAVKVHRQATDYRRERDVYLRLQENDVTVIRDCRVPQLLRYDDELLVIEMTVVTRPFVLDFAGAFLDQAPDFPEEVLADWQAEKREQFGAHWSEVLAILRVLEGYGIYMIDVHPNNISLLDK